MKRLYLITLALILTSCAPECEKVTIVFKEMHKPYQDSCHEEDISLFGGTDFKQGMSASGRSIIYIFGSDGTSETRDPCTYEENRRKYMCAEVATARMQDPTFRDSVLRIE